MSNFNRLMIVVYNRRVMMIFDPLIEIQISLDSLCDQCLVEFVCSSRWSGWDWCQRVGWNLVYEFGLIRMLVCNGICWEIFLLILLLGLLGI